MLPTTEVVGLQGRFTVPDVGGAVWATAEAVGATVVVANDRPAAQPPTAQNAAAPIAMAATSPSSQSSSYSW
jgi:hypothetical protein